jgi:hypothetical protein
MNNNKYFNIQYDDINSDDENIKLITDNSITIEFDIVTNNKLEAYIYQVNDRLNFIYEMSRYDMKDDNTQFTRQEIKNNKHVIVYYYERTVSYRIIYKKDFTPQVQIILVQGFGEKDELPFPNEKLRNEFPVFGVYSELQQVIENIDNELPEYIKLMLKTNDTFQNCY